MAGEADPSSLAVRVLNITSEDDLQALKELLEKTALPIRKLVNDTSALHTSAQRGHAEITSLLLQYGWHPDLRDGKKRTALHLAGSHQVASILLDAQADSSLKDANDLTPLDTAILTDEMELIELLVDRSPASCIPQTLHLAALHNSKAVLQMMVDKGHDLNCRNGISNATALHLVASTGRDGHVTMLLNLGAEVDPLDVQGASPLHWAALHGKVKSVHALVAAGADIDRMDTKRQATPLVAAIQSLNVDLVRFLLDNGADPRRKTVKGRTTLHLAAQNGSPQIVEAILHAGLDPNILDEHRGTAATWAAENGHVEALETLRKFGCDPLRANGQGWTPLHSAAQGGQVEAVRYLLDLGATPDTCTTDGATPASVAVRGKHSTVLALLLDEGAQLSASLVKIAIMKKDLVSVETIISRLKLFPVAMRTFQEMGAIDIMLAVEHKCLNIARLLINAGFDTEKLKPKERENLFLSAVTSGFAEVVQKLAMTGQLNQRMSRDESLMTPVHIAAEMGDMETLRILIDLGFSTSDESQYGQTALHFASVKGHADVVNLLIPTVNVLLKDVNEATALHWAVFNDHLAVVKLLARIPGTLTATNNNKHTPLHLACQEGRYECFKFLLEAGSNPRARDAIQCKPMHLAAGSKSADAVKMMSLLEESGVKEFDCKTVRGVTPLGYAASVGNLEAAKFLALRWVDFRERDDARHTPLHIAVMSGKVGVARFLLGLDPGVVTDPLAAAELWYCASQGADLGPLEMLAQTCSFERLSGDQIIEILTGVVRKGDDETCCFLLDLISRFNKHVSTKVALRALMITSKRGLMESSRHLASLPDLSQETHLGATPVRSALVHKHKDIAAMLVRCGFPPSSQQLLDSLLASDPEKPSDDIVSQWSSEESDSGFD